MNIASRLSAVMITAAVLANTTAPAEDPGFQVWDDQGKTAVVRHSHAMGPDHFVAVQHGAIRFFTRDGEMTHHQSMQGNSGFVPNCGLWEAVVLFDPYGRRFLVAGFGDSFGCYDDVILAVSENEDPHGPWTLHVIDAHSFMGPQYPSNGNPRYMSIGVDSEAVYLAWDTYTVVSPEKRKSWMLAFDRQSLLDGDPIVNGFITNNLTVAYAAAKTFGDAPAQYLATTYGQPIGTTRLTLTAVQDAVYAPIIDHFVIDVSPFDYGPTFLIPSVDSVGLEAFNVIVLRAYYRNGSLWITHQGKPAGEDRVLAIWYEFKMNGWPLSGELPTLQQQGVIDVGPGVHTWIPDLAVDEHGTVAFAFARSAANELHAVGSAFRRAGDSQGTLQGFAIVKSSEFTNPFAFPQTHAYVSSATEDPDAPGVFSVGGPYRITDQFSAIRKYMWAAPLLTSAPGDLNGDGVVNGADLLILLSAWGPCKECGDPQQPPGACPADFNDDCVIDGHDLLFLLSSWG